MKDSEKFEEAKELTELLIHRAEEGKLPNFEFIKNYGMLQAAKVLRDSTYKVAKIFDTEAQSFYQKYLTATKQGIDHLQLLVNHRQHRKWAKFFYESAGIYDNIIYEFKCFAWSKPLTALGIWLFGDERADMDLVDYSGNGFEETGNGNSFNDFI